MLRSLLVALTLTLLIPSASAQQPNSGIWPTLGPNGGCKRGSTVEHFFGVVLPEEVTIDYRIRAISAAGSVRVDLHFLGVAGAGPSNCVPLLFVRG